MIRVIDLDQDSWREFGREAEFVVANYLRLKGWSILLSPYSRGPADLIASKGSVSWCIQVKASTRAARITSQELNKLKELSSRLNASPVLASLQPYQINDSSNTLDPADRRIVRGSNGEMVGVSLGQYMLFLYSVDTWKPIEP